MSDNKIAEGRGKKIIDAILRTRELSLVLVVVIFVLVLVLSTNSFWTLNNITNVLKQMSITCILAIGMTFCISAGGIDLSVGSNMTLGSILMAMTLSASGNDPVSMIVAVAMCGLIGLLNGMGVNYLKLNPFIVTLAMDSICKGVVLVITKGYPVYIPNTSFTYFLGQRNVFGETFPVLIFCIPLFVIIGKLLLDKTVLGNRLLAVGGNRVAASLSGLNSNKLNTISYLICGLFTGIAAIMVTGRLNGGNAAAAGTLGMDAISAAIVGGTSMMGGSGTIVGSMLGALLMQLIRNALVLWQVNTYWQTTVIGVVLILVCSLDVVTNKVKAK
ncbi:MAG: ABC transporter permease [Spirochaetaceae bacterium]|jgi:ribose transport system permease protein|nr:ABC transporter permease [Spirochaetaceae bacterium]